MNYLLSSILLSTTIFITFVQSESLCITNGKTSAGKVTGFLNGEYIETGISNNKPYYTLNMDSTCGYTAAVLQYTGSQWKFTPNAVSNPSYFAICTTNTETPQECTSWDGPSTMATTMTISSGSCPTMCPTTNTLQITNSGNSYCNGQFTRQNNNIFKNSERNLYWYFSRIFDTWYCSTQVNLGCSINSISNSVAGYDNIGSIGSCSTDGTSTTTTTTTTTTTSTSTAVDGNIDNAPVLGDCYYGIDISGRTGSNTFVNGRWNQASGTFNNKPYYTKDGYYIFFMSGCNMFNDWIIASSLHNAIDENICHNNNSNDLDCAGGVSCDELESFWGQCIGNKQNIEDCSGNWQFPEPINGVTQFVVDNSVTVALWGIC